MQEQTRTRGSSSNYVASDQDPNWSEENEIYYYSNFELFQRKEDANQFYQYSIFVEELSKELGEEWRVEAELLCPPHFSSKEVFMNLLSLWLKHHGPRLQPTNQKNIAPTFEQSFVEEFMYSIQVDLEDKQANDIKINTVTARALCMGFFLTANDIWVELFSEPKKPQQPKNIFLQTFSDSIERTFKPIMVVRQKIGSMFGKKKVKRNQDQMELENGNIQVNQKTGQMFENCFHQFRKTLDLQKQVERKMSEFSLDDHENMDQDSDNFKKIVQKDTFNENEAPVKKNLLSSMYNYVTEFLNKAHSWQVANSFVTNILQMGQTYSQQGKKIKILRPAQDFYRKLILVWLSFKEGNSFQVTFHDYLNKVKSAFGNKWHSKYEVPTKYFYEKIVENWDAMNSQGSFKKLGQKEILGIFIRKVRTGMAADWQKKIRITKRHKKTTQQSSK